MTKKYSIRIVLWVGLSLAYVPTMVGQCFQISEESEYCCQGTQHCLAHCVIITGCDYGDTGLDFCSSSYGLCCNDHFTERRPSGYDCSSPSKAYYQRCAVGIESDGLIFAEMLVVPNGCFAKRSGALKRASQSVASDTNHLR